MSIGLRDQSFTHYNKLSWNVLYLYLHFPFFVIQTWSKYCLFDRWPCPGNYYVKILKCKIPMEYNGILIVWFSEKRNKTERTNSKSLPPFQQTRSKDCFFLFCCYIIFTSSTDVFLPAIHSQLERTIDRKMPSAIQGNKTIKFRLYSILHIPLYIDIDFLCNFSITDHYIGIIFGC
jgi:hypothetical protein